MADMSSLPKAFSADLKQDADYVFYELTRSICPECRRVIDAKILIRDNKVYMRKRCPDHGMFEGLVYSDAKLYTSSSKFNKPGTIPLEFATEVKEGCPHDCGLCPDHQQHACLGIIEVNSACDMACPLCFAEAGPGFSLTLEEVEDILDHYVRAEGNPQVVQFSGGEPSIHPQIIPMMKAAQDRGIPNVTLNTNGKRIATDHRFLADLAEIRPNIYFQFDGFDSETYRIIRGEPDILSKKVRALDRLAEIGPAAPLAEPDLRASHPALWIDLSPHQTELARDLLWRIGRAPAVIQRAKLTPEPIVRVCFRHSPPVAARPNTLPIVGNSRSFAAAGTSPHQVPVQETRSFLLADHDSPQPAACVRVVPSKFVRSCLGTNPEKGDPTLEILAQSLHANP